MAALCIHVIYAVIESKQLCFLALLILKATLHCTCLQLDSLHASKFDAQILKLLTVYASFRGRVFTIVGCGAGSSEFNS